MIEPSMPKQPSVVNAMKDVTLSTGQDDAGVRRPSSLDDESQLNEQQRFSLAEKDETEGNVPPPENIKPTTLSAKQKREIAEAFNAFDISGSGYMSTIDLRVALRALGLEGRKAGLKTILKTYDKGATGRLCFSEFVAIIENKLAEPDSKEDLLKAFQLFDRDNMGKISFENLRQIADELGEEVNDEELMVLK